MEAFDKKGGSMKRLRTVHFLAILVISLIFVNSPLAQEKKETEDVYTIKHGDTLWDISSKFLKDPFLWPKLWQRNPYITNPHWIYPGQSIRLSPLEDLKKVEGTQPQEEPKKVVGEEKPKEAIGEAEVKAVEPPPIEKKPEVLVEMKPPFYPETRFAGFLSGGDLEGIGVILDSREGKSLMSQEDIIYLAFKTSEPVMIGDKFTIFRASEVVKHPVTEQRMGKKIRILGNVRIIDKNGDFYTAKVLENFDAIFKGDRIHPYMKERMEDEGRK